MGTYDQKKKPVHWTDDEFAYQETRLEDLKVWAMSNKVDWARSNATHHPWRAAKTIDGEVRLIGVGSNLKRCLWMAYQMITRR
jgi:hypothetical protein